MDRKEHGGRTSMSRHADLRRVIWSAMVSVVKPGSRLANSTIFIMHLVESSLNLSHRPKSSCTLWSALEFWEGQRGTRWCDCAYCLCTSCKAGSYCSSGERTHGMSRKKNSPWCIFLAGTEKGKSLGGLC